MSEVCSKARVPDVISCLLIYDEVCEAEDVIHDCHRQNFIDHFDVVGVAVFVRCDRANEDHLSNREHHEDEELDYEELTEPDNCNCQDDSSQVEEDHESDLSVSHCLDIVLLVECAVYLANALVVELLTMLLEEEIDLGWYPYGPNQVDQAKA